MAPKRQKAASSKSPAKKAKTASKSPADASEASDCKASGSHQKLVQSLLEDKLLGQTYCEELGIDIRSGSSAMFQWLACSNMFGSRIGEVSKSTLMQMNPDCVPHICFLCISF